MGRPLLTLCLIARDEAAVLSRCLDSASPFVDEMVVVDTGSTDETRSIARDRGAKVVGREWNRDFSEARNASLDEASGSYVLVLDADEWIEAGPEPGALRETIRDSGAEAFTVEMSDRLDGGGVRTYPLVRLFRNRPEHRYTGAFHEQITPSIARRIGAGQVPAAPSGLVVGHDGYLLSRHADGNKAERNLDLLKRQVLDDPSNAATRYFLARERTPIRGCRAVPGAHLAEALEHLGWLDEHPGELPPALAADAARLHAAALIADGRPEEARNVLARCPDRGVACELLRADAAILASEGEARAVEEALERVKACFDRETRDTGPFSEPALAGPIARARAAEIMDLLDHEEAAIALAQKATTMAGGGAVPWTALAGIERRRGRPLKALRAHLEGIRVDPVDPWAWVGLGETLLSQGRAADAVTPLRNALELAPGWKRAERALGTARRGGPGGRESDARRVGPES